MSKTIYSIQEKLDSILDIYTCYETPDKELFDLSMYPNGGKGSGYFGGPWFDRTGIKHTKETIQLVSEALKGRPVSTETREKIRQSLLGRKHSKESIRKMSDRQKGKTPWNKGIKGQQVAWNKGKKLPLRSEETKEKIRQSLLRRNK